MPMIHGKMTFSHQSFPHFYDSFPQSCLLFCLFFIITLDVCLSRYLPIGDSMVKFGHYLQHNLVPEWRYKVCFVILFMFILDIHIFQCSFWITNS